MCHSVQAAQYHKKLQTITHLVYFEHSFHHKKRRKIRNWKSFSRSARILGKKKSCTWNVIKLWKYYNKEKKKLTSAEISKPSKTYFWWDFTNFTNLSDWWEVVYVLIIEQSCPLFYYQYIQKVQYHKVFNVLGH